MLCVGLISSVPYCNVYNQLIHITGVKNDGVMTEPLVVPT
jgi:hypothetical protein